MIDADDRELLARAGVLVGALAALLLSAAAVIGAAVRLFFLASGL